MKLKNNVTLEAVCKKLQDTLASDIKVKQSSHPLYGTKFISVDKDSFVGVKIFLKDDQLTIDSYIPGILARSFFGGIIGGIFHHGSRSEFKQKIAEYLVSEFYDK